MLEMFQQPFMLQSLIACLLLAGILSYFGVHVVTRGIVFIDLALAQISSVGVAFALMSGNDPRLFAVLFTLVGAFGISLIQTNDKRVPQEAIIGIIYAVSSALSILMMAKVPHGDSDVVEILFGNILAVTESQIIQMVVVFGAVGLLHLIFHKQFKCQSMIQGEDSDGKGPSLMNRWNILFYLSLALVISSAVGSSGVLQVFAYLIVPAVCALLLFQRFGLVLFMAFIIASLGSLTGLYSSYAYDLPTGAAIVACLGLIFMGCFGIKTLVFSKKQAQIRR